MAGLTLKPVPLTRERFEPFGDVQLRVLSAECVGLALRFA